MKHIKLKGQLLCGKYSIEDVRILKWYKRTRGSYIAVSASTPLLRRLRRLRRLAARLTQWAAAGCRQASQCNSDPPLSELARSLLKVLKVVADASRCSLKVIIQQALLTSLKFHIHTVGDYYLSLFFFFFYNKL